MTTRKKKTEKPIILCCGANGRAVVYGYVNRDPVPGKAVTLRRARLVLYWDAACGGLLGLAAKGPRGSTRITHAVDSVTETVWQEAVSVSPEAARELDEWRA